MNFICRTRGNTNPTGKNKVWVCFENSDRRYAEEATADILDVCDCAVYTVKTFKKYSIEETKEIIDGVSLFVLVVTENFLEKNSDAYNVEYRFAKEKHIPILPILFGNASLSIAFNNVCGDIQFLDKYGANDFGDGYYKKLQTYFKNIFATDEEIAKIKEHFDSYIFLSYRKKDRKYAKELMQEIHKNEDYDSVAIWYDDYLIPGENFNELIDTHLKEADMFALVVTPNLVNEENYVQTIEYPRAIELHKVILPFELASTNVAELKSKYQAIPDAIAIKDSERVKNSLNQFIKGIKKKEKTTEKEYYLGLAFIKGVDVEINYQKGLLMITNAAEAGFKEAVRQLAILYAYGFGVKQDIDTELFWKERYVSLLKKEYEEKKTDQSYEEYQSALLSVIQDYENYNVEPKKIQDTYSLLLENCEKAGKQDYYYLNAKYEIIYKKNLDADPESAINDFEEYIKENKDNPAGAIFVISAKLDAIHAEISALYTLETSNSPKRKNKIKAIDNKLVECEKLIEESKTQLSESGYNTSKSNLLVIKNNFYLFIDPKESEKYSKENIACCKNIYEIERSDFSKLKLAEAYSLNSVHQNNYQSSLSKAIKLIVDIVKNKYHKNAYWALIKDLNNADKYPTSTVLEREIYYKLVSDLFVYLRSKERVWDKETEEIIVCSSGYYRLNCKNQKVVTIYGLAETNMDALLSDVRPSYIEFITDELAYFHTYIKQYYCLKKYKTVVKIYKILEPFFDGIEGDKYFNSALAVIYRDMRTIYKNLKDEENYNEFNKKLTLLVNQDPNIFAVINSLQKTHTALFEATKISNIEAKRKAYIQLVEFEKYRGFYNYFAIYDFHKRIVELLRILDINNPEYLNYINYSIELALQLFKREGVTAESLTMLCHSLFFKVAYYIENNGIDYALRITNYLDKLLASFLQGKDHYRHQFLAYKHLINEIYLEIYTNKEEAGKIDEYKKNIQATKTEIFEYLLDSFERIICLCDGYIENKEKYAYAKVMDGFKTPYVTINELTKTFYLIEGDDTFDALELKKLKELYQTATSKIAAIKETVDSIESDNLDYLRFKYIINPSQSNFTSFIKERKKQRKEKQLDNLLEDYIYHLKHFNARPNYARMQNIGIEEHKLGKWLIEEDDALDEGYALIENSTNHLLECFVGDNCDYTMKLLAENYQLFSYGTMIQIYSKRYSDIARCFEKLLEKNEG